MKRHLLVIFLLVIATLSVNAGDFSLSSITFKAIDVANSNLDIPASNNSQNYNLVFSSILPEGGVYIATDDITGAEAIVQIGYSQIDAEGDKLFCNSSIYTHFVSKYDIQPNEVKIKLSFIGWNKNKKDMKALSLDRLIVTPNKSLDEMKKVENNKYYIQLGSYHFYQNSYPRIIEMLPLLDSYPKFYIVRKTMNRNDKMIDIYRVLSGPFDYEIAKNLADEINSKSENKVFIQSQEKLINENSNEVIYEEQK